MIGRMIVCAVAIGLLAGCGSTGIRGHIKVVNLDLRDGEQLAGQAEIVRAERERYPAPRPEPQAKPQSVPPNVIVAAVQALLDIEGIFSILDIRFETTCPEE